ncbi:9283_t:CDS:2, partial [Acaulospora colombiana]
IVVVASFSHGDGTSSLQRDNGAVGGAERLVVDAALGLQKEGHEISIYTSHHDPAHCFDETRDGTLRVVQYAPPFFLPRSLKGKLHIVFAHLRQLHLTWKLVR